MSSHAIDDNIKNSDPIYCINEYVRYSIHREILKEHWFEDASFEALAAKHHMSVAAIKRVVYGLGDIILLKAAKLSEDPSAPPGYAFML